MSKATRVKALVLAALFAAIIVSCWRHYPVPILWTARAPWVGNELAVGDDGTVYVPGFGVLLAYDPSGKLLWKSPRGVYADSAPVLGEDGTIYLHESVARFKDTDAIGGTNEGVVALSRDGSLKWRHPQVGIDGHPFGTSLSLSLAGGGTVCFITGSGFGSAKTVVALGADGNELWHFAGPDTMFAPLEMDDSGCVLFLSADQTNTHLRRFDRAGHLVGPILTRTLPELPQFSIGPDGESFIVGAKDATMTAVSSNGAILWQFQSPLRPVSSATIGPDGTLYFVASSRTAYFLIALAKTGRLKWQFDLGSHWNFHPPAIAADGTLFVISSDPKVTALNADGTVRWVFEPPRKLGLRLTGGWNNFWKTLRESAHPESRNVMVSPPTLTTNGVLYIVFGGPYDTIYALDVGVGLATNSPWPMQAGNPRLTREAHKTVSAH